VRGVHVPTPLFVVRASGIEQGDQASPKGTRVASTTSDAALLNARIVNLGDIQKQNGSPTVFPVGWPHSPGMRIPGARLALPLHILVTILCCVTPEFAVPGDHVLVHLEPTLGLALTDHAQTAIDPHPRRNTPRERPPIVYFYSRGGRQITNRGAEVFHQLHHAVRREGIVSYLEDGVDKYATIDSQYIEDYDEISQILGSHDNVVVTAIPHAMDESIGALLPAFTGAPFLGNRTRVIKWQIGYSFPSLSYFVDEQQHMICDTYFLMDIMGCVKEAYIRAPPLPLYYEALSAAVDDAKQLLASGPRDESTAEKGGERVSNGLSSPLAIFKERVILYDNDHTFDASKLVIHRGCVLQELDGMTREQMFAAYKRAVAVVDLWLCVSAPPSSLLPRGPAASVLGPSPGLT
jgi:hypothetical protein